MNRRRFLASLLPVAALAASRVRAEPEHTNSLCAANVFCECGHIHQVHLLGGPNTGRKFAHQIENVCGRLCPCVRFQAVRLEIGS